MSTINAENIAINYLWFEAFNDKNIDLEYSIADEESVSGEGALLQMWSTFDHEMLTNGDRRLYLDVGVRLPNVASIMVRSQFALFCDSGQVSLDQLFTVENIKPLLEFAVENAMIGFRDICLERKIEFPQELHNPSAANRSIIDLFCSELVNFYFSRRKPLDEKNTIAQYDIALRCPQVDTIGLTLNLTFLVLDDILFYNHAFNRQHNKKMFFELVPEMLYYTVKLRCLEISKHPIEISQIHLQLLLECVNCAMQVLLGDKGDCFAELLDKQRISEDVLKVYFKSATNLFEVCESNGFTQKRADWTVRIR